MTSPILPNAFKQNFVVALILSVLVEGVFFLAVMFVASKRRVEFVESTNNYDLYTAEYGTSVRLQAVNETRMFTGWVITKNSESTKTNVPSSTNNPIITFDVDSETADLDVSVTRVNATASECVFNFEYQASQLLNVTLQ